MFRQNWHTPAWLQEMHRSSPAGNPTAAGVSLTDSAAGYHVSAHITPPI